jgi:ABC-type dipeptide/oligopeptide/nickel transport system ATPase component
MLSIENLSAVTAKGEILLQDINLYLNEKEVIFLIGKSGCGKTTILKVIMGILDTSIKVKMKKFKVDNIDINKLNMKDKRKLYGKIIGFIPQNPMNVFDPRKNIKSQMLESFKVSLGMDKKKALILAKEMLIKVNLNETERVLNSLPEELSGGMLQRIVIAILLGIKPKYILADEPVSALDDDNKMGVMNLLLSLRKDSGLIITTHNIDLLIKENEKTMVIVDGKIVKEGIFSTNDYLQKDEYCSEEGDFIWTVCK